MRRILSVILLLGCLPLLGADKPNAAEQVVVLDSWWGEDFANRTCEDANAWRRENADAIREFGCDALVSCPEMMKQLEGCAQGAAEQYRAFESDIATEMSADATCHGIRFFVFRSSETSDRSLTRAMLEPHWTLGLNFIPGAPKQNWWLIDSSRDDRGRGEASAATIVKKVCSIVNQLGANVKK